MNSSQKYTVIANGIITFYKIQLKTVLPKHTHTCPLTLYGCMALVKMGSLRKHTLKGSVLDQKWLFYGISPKQPLLHLYF